MRYSKRMETISWDFHKMIDVVEGFTFLQKFSHKTVGQYHIFIKFDHQKKNKKKMANIIIDLKYQTDRKNAHCACALYVGSNEMCLTEA